MEIKISTKKILLVLQIICWIIFVGVFIDACGYIFASFYTMTYNSANARTFWPGNDLSDLYAYDKGHFLVIVTFMCIVALMKAAMFYAIIKILQDKSLSLSQPFSRKAANFISLMALLALGAGLFSGWGVSYTEWLVKKGIEMPDTYYLNLGGGDVWIFMSVALFVVGLVFKRGIEIQTENELTV